MENFDQKAYDKQANFTKDDTEKIVKIQAAIRSKKTRMDMHDGSFFKEKLVEDPTLEFVDGHTFEDGTVYNGQIKANKKQGYGV